MSLKSSIYEKEFEEIDEPSVLSSDPKERKLARRLRIQRREEALQKLDGTDEYVVENTVTEKQILASEELIEKLIAEGNEVISNVRVANDAREIERRKEASRICDKFLQRLEESAEDCKNQYDAINSRWLSILDDNDPLNINAQLKYQKERCDEVLARKDAVIAELKRELKNADDMYFDDQRKQRDDIKILTERIENQINTMENVYSRELGIIEKVLKTERDTLVNKFQKQWDTLYKLQEEEDIAGDEKTKQIMREYEAEMERVLIEHDEEYRAQKIELENECQSLQQQVERTKAMCILNSEKLSYNYNVLKSREEENTVVKNQQKRKINRLQSIVNNLRKNYKDLEEDTKSEIEKYSNQILKSHKSISELEEQSILFTRVNDKQYMEIWDMNAENANLLVKKILAADKIIHERTLGVAWEPPIKSIPKKDDLPSYCLARDVMRKRKLEEADRLKIFEYKNAKNTSEIKLEREILNNILKQISSCSGYLIEDKLQELIANRSEEEKTIIRLDSVFQALSISTPEEINMLLDFFLPYAYCPICTLKEDTPSLNDLSKASLISSKPSTCREICEGCNDENVKKLINTVRKEIGHNSEESDKSSSSSSSDSYGYESVFSEEYRAEDNSKSANQLKRYTCDKGHILRIQAVHVTKVMKEIVMKLSAAEQKEMLSFEERLREKKFTISRSLTVQDVESFWLKYREIFGPQKEKLWDAILMGLNKYFEVLKERQKLCSETENLRKQNAELEQLLESNMSSTNGDSSLLQIRSTKHSSYK